MTMLAYVLYMYLCKVYTLCVWVCVSGLQSHSNIAAVHSVQCICNCL